MINRLLIIIIFLFYYSSAKGQLPVMPVNHLYNQIENSAGLNPVFIKLYDLLTKKNRKVNIVHIGDSHIQADFMSGVMRQKLQTVFGNGGRGIVFPYQLAISNSPTDIRSSSNNLWEFNRIAHPEINIAPGVSGFVIKTSSTVANIDFEILNLPEINTPFNKIKLFTDTISDNAWMLRTPGSSGMYLVKHSGADTSAFYHEIILDSQATAFSMASLPSGNEKYVYGFSLENNTPGLIYHTIGVNGSRYEQFNMAPLFWKQLGQLNADLYIVSLGTNEAQKTDYSDSAFCSAVGELLKKLSHISPGIPVLITTAPDTFKNNRPNKTVAVLNTTLVRYCQQKNIPYWDLFQMNRGSGSCFIWNAKGLMNRDKIHFTSSGYRIFGEQLYHLFMKTYSNYIRSVPSKTADK